MNQFFLFLSIIFAFISPIIGIVSVLKGSFKPQRMTRFLIFGISLLFVGTLFAQGDRNGIYIALAQLLGSFIIFVLSINRGLGGTHFSDFIVLALACVSLYLWQSTQNPLLGLFLSILADVTAFSPTLIKTWKQPQTEEWRFYLSDVFASSFSLLSITAFSLETLTFPIYILIINSVSVIMILTRRRHTADSNNSPTNKGAI